MKSKKPIGKVYFIGAGPGDPDLLTIKGARLLREADVILHDRLVSTEILEFVKPDAEIILTGKQRGGRCTPQTTISNLIAEVALQGKNVVRLKGGDVSFFSNIFDELNVVSALGIEFEIVPGVTAASGCAAYAGIPITARGYSNAVRFLTLHQADILNSKEWEELANCTDTIIFYMSAANTLHVVKQLLQHGADGEIPIVVIEQGTTPNQREYFSELQSAEEEFKVITFQSPATIIIGSVVKLAQKFKWFDSSVNGAYFTELTDIEQE